MTEAHSAGESAPPLDAAPVPAQAPSIDLEKSGADVDRSDVAANVPAAGVPDDPSRSAPADEGRITFQSMAERLTLGLVAAALGAVLVFISAFLTWSTVDARSTAGNKIAGATIDTIGVSSQRLGTATLVLSIAALVMIGVMLLPATKPWSWKVLLGFGVLIVVFALVDLLSIPRTLRPENFSCPAGVTCSFHRSIGPGVWFTLVAGLVVIAGAYIHHVRPVRFRSARTTSTAAGAAPAAPVAPVAEPAIAQPLPEATGDAAPSGDAPPDHSVSSASGALPTAEPAPADGASGPGVTGGSADRTDSPE